MVSSFFCKDLFIYYMEVHCSCLQTPQKRPSDLITDGCEPSYGCWDLNSQPSKEQSALLTAEPSLQPSFLLFMQSKPPHHGTTPPTFSGWLFRLQPVPQNPPEANLTKPVLHRLVSKLVLDTAKPLIFINHHTIFFFFLLGQGLL